MLANFRSSGRVRYLPLAVVAMAAGLSGCKAVSEKYIALEVWKYERLFGHYPPGFVPPGAGAAQPRLCGQGSAPTAACGPATADCHQCEGGHSGGTILPGPPVGPAALPAGPGGSPGPSASLPAGASVTSSRPVVISDEVVLP